MNHLVRSWAASSAFLLALGLAAGCSEEKKVSAVADDAGAPDQSKKPALGGKLAAAVEAAEAPQAGGAAKGGDGPPEKGIFAAGAADKVLANGAAPKLEVLGDGSDPKVLLAYAPEGEQKATVNVAFRQQGRGLPVEYTLAVKVDKPKDKPKDDKKPDQLPDGARVIATIAGLSLPPQVPKEALDQLGKLKGSEIRYRLGAQGAISDVSFSLAKGADPGLDQFLRQIVEGIGVLVPPVPAKPVGVGAYWMVTDRPTGGLVDVVRYRVFRVEKVEKDHATLSIDIRQYAAKGDIDAGEGQKLALDQFESQGKGKTEWTAQGLLPLHGDASVKMGAAGRIQTGQQAMLQAESTVKVDAATAEKKK